MTPISAAHLRIRDAMIARAASLTLCYTDERRGRLVVGVDAQTHEVRAFVRELAGRVPLTLATVGHAVRHANKQDLHRPLIGGIEIRSGSDAQRLQRGTILGATPRGGGGLGFVTAGHVVETPESPVYQPTRSETRLVGFAEVVSDYRRRAVSDSAFIRLSEDVTIIPYKIWKRGGTTYNIISTRIPDVGDRVCMQGASTKMEERAGYIAATNATVRFEDGGILEQQLIANYLSQTGDSGAPVYTQMTDQDVALVGLNVGAATADDVQPRPDEQRFPPQKGTYAVISTWANVASDLGLDALQFTRAPKHS